MNIRLRENSVIQRVAHSPSNRTIAGGIALLWAMVPAQYCLGQASQQRDSTPPSVLEFESAGDADAARPIPKLRGSHAVVRPVVQDTLRPTVQDALPPVAQANPRPAVVHDFGQPLRRANASHAKPRTNHSLSNGAATITQSASSARGPRPAAQRLSPSTTALRGPSDVTSDQRQSPSPAPAVVTKSLAPQSPAISRLSPTPDSARPVARRWAPNPTLAPTPEALARQLQTPVDNQTIAPVVASPLQSVQQPSPAQAIKVDHQVQPTTYAAPIQDRPRSFERSFDRNQDLSPMTDRRSASNRNRQTRRASANNPQSVLETFSIQNNPIQSDSIALRLADVLNQGQQRASRSQLVMQYWETFFDSAQSQSAQRHSDWVNQLPVSKSTDQATVAVARSSAKNEVAFNEIQLGKSQAKLKSMLGSTSSIVPSDLPTVKPVKTNYKAFKQRGLVPARFEGIDDTLKKLHALVSARAQTVIMAQQSAQQVKKYYKSHETSIDHLLSVGKAWRDAEADFIASTVEYNKAYADYALALPYGQAPVEQVVLMLVPTQTIKEVPIADARPKRTSDSNFSRSPGNAPANRGYSPNRNSTGFPMQPQAQSQPRQSAPPVARSASLGFDMPPQKTERPSLPAAKPASSSGFTPKTFGSTPKPPSKPTSGFGGGGFSPASTKPDSSSPTSSDSSTGFRSTPDFGSGFSPSSSANTQKQPASKPSTSGFGFGG